MHVLTLSSNYPVTAAFIPLAELSDSGIAKKYGVKPDAETLDILNTVAQQKEVVSTFYL